MRNHIQPGRVLDVTAPANVDAGELVIVGAIVGVAAGDAQATESVSIHTEGVFALDKVPAVVFTQGETVYVPAAGGPVTDNSDADSNSGGTVKVGYATEAAGAGAATVNVRLVPNV